MKNALYLSFTFCLCLLFGSCLTYEKKDVSLRLNADGSLSVRVKYYNILSDSLEDTEPYDYAEPESPGNIKYADALEICEGDSILAHDLYVLQNRYLGDMTDCIETDYLGAVMESKRLFEENGTLCAEVSMKIAPEVFAEEPNDLGVWYNSANGLFIMHFMSKDVLGATNGILKEGYPVMLIWQNVQETMTYTEYGRGRTGKHRETYRSMLPYWKKATGN